MAKRYPQTWDLDVFFAGGSASPAFASYLDQLKSDLDALMQRVRRLTPPASGAGAAELAAFVNDFQDASRRLREAGAFVGCLEAQDVYDEGARLLRGRLGQMGATLGNIRVLLDRVLVGTDEATFQQVLRHEGLAPLAFFLEERRRRAAEMLPPEQEELINDLSVDGYHAWGQLYDLVVGRMTIAVEEEGEVVRLSVGQAANRLLDPDRARRAAVFARWEEAWSREADLCAAALNHLAGYRLNVYRRRGWDSVLKEPLELNRLSAAALEAMWGVIEDNKERLAPYFRRKAELLGIDALSWHDVEAPIAASERSLTYDEAADFVLEQFGRFSPDLQEFARRALTERWVEAEDRPGKEPGGFCSTFPVSGQSRIFMTFGGRPRNIGTLAHELGHAYHAHVMRDLPFFLQSYPMSLAETASTFAEHIVTEAAIRHAADEQERLALLEDRLQRAVAFFMNIRARFLFETAFYERRRQGPVSVAELNRLMVDAQKHAYAGLLAEYHPHFWASKLHFYITGMPFYNFPYTFGYLFSTGVYARAREEGPAFADRYVALLRDSGRMRVEDVARRHLGVDLAQPGFWQEAVDAALADLDEFLRLSAPAPGAPVGDS